VKGWKRSVDRSGSELLMDVEGIVVEWRLSEGWVKVEWRLSEGWVKVEWRLSEGWV